jgi:hypothetical protein
LGHKAFRKGDITTHFIDTHFKDLLNKREEIPMEALIALCIYDFMHSGSIKKKTAAVPTADPYSPWKRAGKWRIGD